MRHFHLLAAEGDVDLAVLVDDRHFGPRLQPQSVPLGWVAQFAVWIAAAACDKPGEGDAPGGLVGGIVAQVKAPADLVADVGIGAVDGLLVDADDVAALDRQGMARSAAKSFSGTWVAPANWGALSM